MIMGAPDRCFVVLDLGNQYAEIKILRFEVVQLSKFYSKSPVEPLLECGLARFIEAPKRGAREVRPVEDAFASLLL